MNRNTFVGLALAMTLASANGYADSLIPAHIKDQMNRAVGTWEYEQETKQTQTSEFEKSAGSWIARWIYDYLIETRVQWPEGGSGIEYTGYNPMTQIYGYWFTSNGVHGHYVDGYWDGNSLNFDNFGIDSDGAPWRGRCKFSYNDDFSEIVNYQCESLENGEWYIWRKGRAKKVKE